MIRLAIVLNDTVLIIIFKISIMRLVCVLTGRSLCCLGYFVYEKDMVEVKWEKFFEVYKLLGKCFLKEILAY